MTWKGVLIFPAVFLFLLLAPKSSSWDGQPAPVESQLLRVRPGEARTGLANCWAGQHATGGGYSLIGASKPLIMASTPSTGGPEDSRTYGVAPTGWKVAARNEQSYM